MRYLEKGVENRMKKSYVLSKRPPIALLRADQILLNTFRGGSEIVVLVLYGGRWDMRYRYRTNLLLY